MVEKTWLEVSLTVDGELAEAVAEVLARFVPNGVVIESTYIAPDPNGEGVLSGPLRVCGYLPAQTDLEETRRRLEEALWYLGRISPLPAPQFKLIQEVNWVETWKGHYQPIPVGERLIVVPAWLEAPVAERIPVRIDPGMAFGTGTHPSTQLCLELAESRVIPGGPVIDVGCGSGILSIASLKLGAAHALGLDIEPEAITAARQNARLNAVDDRLELGLGSVAEVLAGSFSIRRAPLVFANILAPVIIQLFSLGLGKLVQPGGCCILAGILSEQETGVREALRAHGLQLQERRQMEDWVALCAVRQ